MLKVELLVIDPQNGFCDPGTGYELKEKPGLYVGGADKDMERLASFIKRAGYKFNGINLTMDQHHRYSIFHSIFWSNSKGEHPAPFTVITLDDANNNTWFATVPQHRKIAKEYVQTLAANGWKKNLTIV